MAVLPDRELLAHLVSSRLAGRVATPASSSRHNSARLVEGHPDYTFGLSDWRHVTYADVLAALRAAGGTELEVDGAEHPDGGFIDAAATLAGMHAHRRALAGFVAAGGGKVLLATGHPGPLLPHYGALARALAAAGCAILRPLDGQADLLTTPDGRPCSVRYVDGVAALSFDGGLQHTHRSRYMEAILDAAGGADGSTWSWPTTASPAPPSRPASPPSPSPTSTTRRSPWPSPATAPPASCSSTTASTPPSSLP